METMLNPPVERLILLGPREVTRRLILDLHAVMAERGKLPAFYRPASLEEALALLMRPQRTGVLLADSEEENHRSRQWLRQRVPDVKIMRLSPDPAANSPFSYQDVRFPFPRTRADYNHIAAWFGITSYSSDDPVYRIYASDAVRVQDLLAETLSDAKSHLREEE